MGSILTDIRKEIRDPDRATPTELGTCYRTPEGIWAYLLRKNDILMGDGQGLADGVLVKAFRASNILNAYQFRNEIIRQTAPVDFAERMDRAEHVSEQNL